MRCELCGSDEAVELSSGLVICRPCFWTPGRLTIQWIGKRFAGSTREKAVTT